MKQDYPNRYCSLFFVLCSPYLDKITGLSNINQPRFVLCSMFYVLYSVDMIRYTNSPIPQSILIVQLHDQQSAAIIGATITIRNSETDREITSAITNSQGQAIFTLIEQQPIRVAIHGTTPNGVQLIQYGNDAKGIWFQLLGPQNRLDLVVEPDGQVVPDPVSMISSDQPFPVSTAIQPPQPGTDSLIQGVPTAQPFLEQPHTGANQAPFAPILVGMLLCITLLLLVILRQRSH